MTDAPLPALSTDIDVAPKAIRPAVRPLAGGWDFMVRGWRPAGGWICVAILGVRGVVMPIVELVRGEPIAPIDFVALTAFVGMLGLSHWRSKEKIAGVSA